MVERKVVSGFKGMKILRMRAGDHRQLLPGMNWLRRGVMTQFESLQEFLPGCERFYQLWASTPCVFR